MVLCHFLWWFFLLLCKKGSGFATTQVPDKFRDGKITIFCISLYLYLSFVFAFVFVFIFIFRMTQGGWLADSLGHADTCVVRGSKAAESLLGLCNENLAASVWLLNFFSFCLFYFSIEQAINVQFIYIRGHHIPASCSYLRELSCSDNVASANKSILTAAALWRHCVFVPFFLDSI